MDKSDVKIRIAGTISESIVDGPGIRYVIFTQGCSHKCEGCHNPETHDYNGGRLASINDIMNEVKANPLLDGITLSGGEPFDQALPCAIIAKEIKNLGLNVITYTGYLFEKLFDRAQSDKSILDLLRNTDVLIDGPFILSKRNILLRFRGSENQRVIDLNKTMNNYSRDKQIYTLEW